MKRAKKIFISQLFFLITISLIANKAFFSHIHILPDGSIIVHAHPYSKKKQDNSSKKTNHSHTNFSFYVIDQSNRFDHVPVTYQDIVLKPDLQVFSKIIVNHHFTIDSFFTELIDNRGPPFVFA